MGKTKVDIMIATCDRPTEIGLLLQSLRTSTFQDFDVFVLDDGSKTPIQQYYFINYMIGRMKMEGHRIKIIRNNIPSGVSSARQQLCDIVDKHGNGDYCLRLDDDIIIEPDYIEKLFKVIEAGYDIASGVTPPLVQPELVRETKFIKPIANEVFLDEDGYIIKNGDSCGACYLTEEIIPMHHFRSCALYKKEIHKDVNYRSRLSKHGFREEEIWSFKAIIKGYKIGLNTQAVVYHLLTPSGGERPTQDKTMFNEEILLETTKRMFEDNGDFIQEYNKKILGTKRKKEDINFKVDNLILIKKNEKTN